MDFCACSSCLLPSALQSCEAIPCSGDTVKDSYPWKCVIIRAHSFPRPAEFLAKPWNLGFFRGIEPRNLTAEFVFLTWNAAEFDVFLSNNYFFTENDLKVALLQFFL